MLVQRKLTVPGALQIAIRMDQQCKVLCIIKSLNKGQAKAFQKKIDDDYRVNM